jgi:hypothetical protein
LEIKPPEVKLASTLERWWPDLDNALAGIASAKPLGSAERSVEDMVEEVLDLVRDLTNEVATVGAILDSQARLLEVSRRLEEQQGDLKGIILTSKTGGDFRVLKAARIGRVRGADFIVGDQSGKVVMAGPKVQHSTAANEEESGDSIMPRQNPSVKSAHQWQRAAQDAARLFDLSPFYSNSVQPQPTASPATEEIDPLDDGQY